MAVYILIDAKSVAFFVTICIYVLIFHPSILQNSMNLVFCVPEVDPEIATLETYKCRLFVFSTANFSNWLIQLGIHENKHERMPHSKM